MKIQCGMRLSRSLAVAAICLVFWTQYVWAQNPNLGKTPITGVAAPGENGAQPEGAFLNFINWIANVISPIAAGGAVVGAVFSWITGRGAGRWLIAAGAFLAVSGITRLIEFWVTQGTAGAGAGT